ncbi:MAG: hypothetical protein V3T81_08465, partial [Thermoanaerobaculia bacterium]
SYCAARVCAISGRPRSSLGDTIPSGDTITTGDTIPSCPQCLLRSSLRVARSGAHSGRSRRNRMNNPG